MQLCDRQEQFRKYFVVLIHCNASWSLIIPPETDLKRPHYGRDYAPTMDKSLESKKDKTESQRWSPRGQILKSLALASKVKSLALALKPQVLENCPILGSRTAVFFELFKFCGALEKFFGKRFFVEIAWKIFVKTFFFGEHLCLCPWSLALASNIPVLGLESVCPRKGCPWPWPRIFLCPWPRALCPRLHFCWIVLIRPPSLHAVRMINYSSHRIPLWTTWRTLSHTKTKFLSVCLFCLGLHSDIVFQCPNTCSTKANDTNAESRLHVFLIFPLFLPFLFQVRDRKIPSFALFCVLLGWGNVVPHILLFFLFFQHSFPSVSALFLTPPSRLSFFSFFLR